MKTQSKDETEKALTNLGFEEVGEIKEVEEKKKQMRKISLDDRRR